jgi:hypothetical protein
VLGIAAEAGSEGALKTHPDVIKAGDFSADSMKAMFDRMPLLTRAELLPDVDGSTMLRGRFVTKWQPGETSESDLHWAFDGSTLLMPGGDAVDPNMPPLWVENEMFARLYVMLEDDFDSTLDGNKMAMGWDLRMGWWHRDMKYWQNITGNGGLRGDGRRYLIPRQKSWFPHPTQYGYHGHSIRMEAGKASKTGNPYAELRPIQSYTYNIDQTDDDYGDMLRLGTGVIRKGRWFCVEQQIKMNSVVGPFDVQGNGEAVADGVMRTWLDGALVSEYTQLRWRRHPQMGVQGAWINWYFGGKPNPDREMHWRMNHFVVARKYIGPRV